MPTPLTGRRDLVVIGTSGGGLDALRALVGALPASLPASVFIVQHMAEQSLLLPLLTFSSPLPVIQPQDQEEVQPGHIYLARPNYHLILDLPQVRQVRGNRENGFRPSIDVLFRSAAQYGPRVIGVLLTGSLDDGVAGLAAIRRRGGQTIVQDPREATEPQLPLAALRYSQPDRVLDLRATAEAIADGGLSDLPEEAAPVPADDEQIISRQIQRQVRGLHEDSPSLYSCPECGGVMWAIREGDLTRYRCHIGHGFTEATLMRAQEGKLEEALDGAVRLLREKVLLYETLQDRSRAHGKERAADSFGDQSRQAREHARQLERLLTELARYEEHRQAPEA